MYIQQASKQLNISKKAIMFYEQKGLVKPQKDEHGYRIYDQNDMNQLMKIKCLREFDFTISQIKDILLNHQYDIFDTKKAEYEKQIFELETSLQYIDDMKTRIVQNRNLQDLHLQIEETKQLKNIRFQETRVISFEYIIVCLSVFAYALLNFYQTDWRSMIASFIMFIILSIHFSSTFRVFLYKLYSKSLLYPKGRDVKLR